MFSNQCVTPVVPTELWPFLFYTQSMETAEMVVSVSVSEIMTSKSPQVPRWSSFQASLHFNLIVLTMVKKKNHSFKHVSQVEREAI